MRFFFASLSLVLSAAVAAESAVSLEGAWVRALPPTQPNTAAYLTIKNGGTESLEIVSARAAGADRVEFHTTREVDGYVRMEQLATLKLAAGQSLALAPGGTHLMLLGLNAMPVPGDRVSLCLTLATGPEVCTDASVRKDAGDSVHQHHHH
jgi:copper(I)-binding protein